MTLEFKKISKHINRLSEQAARRKHTVDEIVPQVRQILHDHADDANLRERARIIATSQKWRGAIPTNERLDLAQDPPVAPSQVTIVASDGSQIYPDVHGAVLYYLINVGTIVFKQGSGEAPRVETEPHLYDESDMPFDEDEQAVIVPSAALVDARRTLAEMSKLTDLALAEVKLSSTVALMDGQLALWVRDLSITDKEQKHLLDQYVHYLDELRQASVVIGGFFSRRKSMMVTALARLTQTNDDGTHDFKTPPFLGVPDTEVFKFLNKNQRSAVFEVASQWNDFYRQKGHSVHFFYVNVGTTLRPEIARIEIPAWVVSNPEALNLLHAVVVEQCRATGQYPYVLGRAHEIAVVTNKERASFEEILIARLTRIGIDARPSGKAVVKTLLAGVKQH